MTQRKFEPLMAHHRDMLGKRFEWDEVTQGWWEIKDSKTDPVVDAVVDQFKQRSQVGINKYGVTLARDDLSLHQWIQHAIEESMDLTLYLKRIQMELEKTK